MTTKLHRACRSLLKEASAWRHMLPLYVTAGFASSLVGQVSTPPDEEIYELSPFVVSTENDRGYLATNSVSGTSLNMRIRDLPMPLEVINREMLDDMQATDLKESLRYSAGVFTQTFATTSTAVSGFQESSPSANGADVNNPFQNTISIRGYKVPNQQRMGFRVGGIVPKYGVVLGGNTDTITTERSEVVRGPQALLYGINVLSGIVNIIPKRPMSEFGGRVSLSTGNYDYLRAAFEATGPAIHDVLNYNVMAAHHEQGTKKMFNEYERDTFAIQFDYKITPKISLFVEYLNSDQMNKGIGSKFFTDDGSGGLSDAIPWRNEFGERIVYGRDDPRKPIVSEYGDIWPDGPVVENPNRAPGFYDNAYSDLGPYYNVSGPDTYLHRKEKNYLGLLTLRPTRNLTFELGAYHTVVEDERRDVDLRVFTNNLGGYAPTGDAHRPDQRPRPFYNSWLFNPEAVEFNAEGDNYGYGPGEAFVFPIKRTSVTADAFTVYYDDPPAKDDVANLTRKYARYIWYKVPTTAKTWQLRGRAAYKLEKDLFSIPAVHTFTGGYHFIRDEIAFVQDPMNRQTASSYPGRYDQAFYQKTQTPTASQLNGSEPFPESTDPVYFRSSVYDFNPIRYTGQTLAFPGLRTYGNLGAGNSSSNMDVMRSGWKEAMLWYRGMYGVYQGQFWNDKLTIIGGLRRDSYQVREQEHLVIADKTALTDLYVGHAAHQVIPELIGYGDQPYTWRSHLPDALNQKVENSIERIRMQQNGTVEHLYPEYQNFTTGTFGLSWRITEAFSFYYLYSEGVFPNTGQRDGNYKAIDAEQTRNNELGFKFEFFDGKISGTLSAFQIKRKNAVYNWADAPAPSKWYGGLDGPVSNTGGDRFDYFAPKAAMGPGSGQPDETQYPIAYAVAEPYVKLAAEKLNRLDEYNQIKDKSFNPNAGTKDEFNDWGAVSTASAINWARPEMTFKYVSVPYETLNNDSRAEILKEAFDLAMQYAPVPSVDGSGSNPFIGSPILYSGVNYPELNNGSEGRGGSVLFEEEGVGIDGQIVFSPLTNYQIIFTFAYQKREVTGSGFTLVDPIDADGNPWGTEYDRWVYVLGIENFEDPKRPSTYNGNSVRGLDLSFVPSTSLRLMNKYQFREGFLEGLEIGGGVEYNGSVETAVPIGGSNLAENRYLTPAIPARYTFNAFIVYSKELLGFDWTLRLNVNNLLNDDAETLYADYVNEFGAPERRRTEILYEPRTWRLSLSMRF